MATKLGRKSMPAGTDASAFTYQGRPAADQGDFGAGVGLADMACVNQFGEANNSKYYHGGVVKSSDGRWWVYLEWGRIFAGQSWPSSRGFCGQDFQFVQCSSESDARSFFATQMKSKNTARLERKTIAGVEVWAGKAGKDGYIVQQLATRQRGLPDAYAIKSTDGLDEAKIKKSVPITSVKTDTGPTKTFHKEVVDLALALIGGTKTYTRAMSKAAGVTPTMASITQVRDQLIPAAMKRIAVVGGDVSRQAKDPDLIDISKMVAALVPRPIPRTGQSAEEAILSGGNILMLQQDLDAFEQALLGEDFGVQDAKPTATNPDTMLNASLTWMDPRSEGRWVAESFVKMSNKRHGYISRDANVRRVFRVERHDRDAPFMRCAERVASQRKGSFSLRANLQPRRQDLAGQEGDVFAQANVILGIHGTRPVNIAPIMGGNFRLPKQLPQAQIAGANFGHGIYFATDWRKSYGYTGRGYWGGQSGDVRNRGCFMFLCDMIMGDAYRAPSTGSWSQPPSGKDSVFGVGGDRGHRLENDEHVIFDPHYQRIRYLVEFDWLT